MSEGPVPRWGVCSEGMVLASTLAKGGAGTGWGDADAAGEADVEEAGDAALECTGLLASRDYFSLMLAIKTTTQLSKLKRFKAPEFKMCPWSITRLPSQIRIVK